MVVWRDEREMGQGRRGCERESGKVRERGRRINGKGY